MAERNFDPFDVEFQFITLTGGLDALATLIEASTSLPSAAELGYLVSIVADNARALQTRVLSPG